MDKNVTVLRIEDPGEKQRIARQILEALKEWFEVEESREQYIADCKDWIFLAAKMEEEYVGFICLRETGKATVDLAVMGVLKSCHRHGVGRALFEEAKKIAAQEGYSFMQVKTVRMGMYEDYDRTNRFYLGVGFQEFEVLPELWDEANPCQIYVMYLGQ